MSHSLELKDYIISLSFPSTSQAKATMATGTREIDPTMVKPVSKKPPTAAWAEQVINLSITDEKEQS
jgi:hypothetical protein